MTRGYSVSHLYRVYHIVKKQFCDLEFLFGFCPTWCPWGEPVFKLYLNRGGQEHVLASLLGSVHQSRDLLNCFSVSSEEYEVLQISQCGHLTGGDPAGLAAESLRFRRVCPRYSTKRSNLQTSAMVKGETHPAEAHRFNWIGVRQLLEATWVSAYAISLVSDVLHSLPKPAACCKVSRANWQIQDAGDIQRVACSFALKGRKKLFTVQTERYVLRIVRKWFWITHMWTSVGEACGCLFWCGSGGPDTSGYGK